MKFIPDKKMGAIFMVIILVSSSIWFVPLVTSSDIENSDIIDFIPHAPIRIDSNGDFSIGVNGITQGDGSAGNPWVIENLDINGTGYGYCIYVGNTTEYFTVRNCNLYDAYGINSFPFFVEAGFELYNAGNCTLFNNILSMNEHGIRFIEKCNNNTVYDNYAVDNVYGMSLRTHCTDNEITKNNVSLNEYGGILIGEYCSNNEITCNMIFDNAERGIQVSDHCTNVIISDNIVVNSTQGIRFILTSENNLVYHNNIIGCSANGYEQDLNFWNNGYPDGGNYWSDYTGIDIMSGPLQNIPGSDGIGDTPYTNIGGGIGSQDNYPLMAPLPPSFGPVHNLDTDEYFNKIQTAIDDPDTLDGHSITVDAGIYYENLIVNKRLAITGQDKDATIIDGQNNGDVVLIIANGVAIEGFTIRNSGILSNDAGIKVFSARNCEIYDNSVDSNENGILLSSFTNEFRVISDDTMYEHSAQMNNNGQITWIGDDGNDDEVFLWDGNSVIQLSNNSFDDYSPKINENGQVVWYAGDISSQYEIYFWDGASTIQMTSNAIQDEDPSINDLGQIAWSSNLGDREILFWDGNSTVQITNNGISDTDPVLNNMGQIVWQYWESDREIHYWNGTDIVYITDNELYDTDPALNNFGQIAYYHYDGEDGEIYLWENGETIHLSNNSVIIDKKPVINDAGQVAWYTEISMNSSHREIYFWDGTSTQRLTNDSYADYSPKLNENGEIVWHGFDGNDYEIYLWNGISTTQITDNNISDYSNDINDASEIVMARDGDIIKWSLFGDLPENTIIDENIISNNGYGIKIYLANNTEIYHNTIFNNGIQAIDNGTNTRWDDGYPSGGNFWSDYYGLDKMSGPGQTIPGADGIGDIRYQKIEGTASAEDYYPLIAPYGSEPVGYFDWLLVNGSNLMSCPMDPIAKGNNGVFDSYDALQICYAATGDTSLSIEYMILGKDPEEYVKFQYGQTEAEAFPLDSVHGYRLNSSVGTPTVVSVSAVNYTNPTDFEVDIIGGAWNLLGFPHNCTPWSFVPRASDFTDGSIDPDLDIDGPLTTIILRKLNWEEQWYNSYIVTDTFPGMEAKNWDWDFSYSDMPGNGFWIWVDFNETFTFKELIEEPSMTVMKSGPATANSGEDITYTINYSNEGGALAYNVIIQETYPAGITFINSSIAPNNPGAGDNIWNIGTVMPGTQNSINITVHVNFAAFGVLTNVVQLNYENHTGPQPVEIDMCDTDIINPYMVITKEGPATANPGEIITYWLNYTNIGTDWAYNVTVTETYPAGVTYIASTPLPSMGDNVWFIGDIAPGASGSIMVTVVVNANSTGMLVNVVELNYDSAVMAQPPSSDTCVTNIIAPLMAVDKTGPVIALPDQMIMYTITYENIGTDWAYNITVTDTYPANVTFIASVPFPSMGNNVWVIPSLAPGAVGTIIVTVQVNNNSAGNLTNYVEVSYENSAGIPCVPESASCITVVQSTPSMIVEKNGPATVNSGQLINYTISYFNIGPVMAYNAVIEDAFPPGLTYVSSDPPWTVMTGSSILWNIGTVPAGSSGNITVTFANTGYVESDVFTNWAYLNYTDAIGNPYSDVDSFTSMVIEPHMSINKDGPSIATQNETITYWINFTNSGSDWANNVIVTETYPAEVAFVSSMPAPDIGVNVWVVGAVAAPGSSFSIQINVQITGMTFGNITNWVHIDYENNAGLSMPQESDFVDTIVMNSFTIPLHDGWNLISFPLIQADTSIEVVLGSISGNWNVAKWYDPEDSEDPWKTYRVGAVTNDLFDLDNTMGFWLYVTDSTDDLIIYGETPVSTNITLKAGWNLVSYPSSSQERVSNAIWGSGIDEVECYDETSPSLLRDMTGFNNVIPGNGYWVHVAVDSVWTVNW